MCILAPPLVCDSISVKLPPVEARPALTLGWAPETPSPGLSTYPFAPSRFSELPPTRLGVPQHAHSWNQPRILAHPHRLISRFLVATSESTLSQPRCSSVTLVPPSIASKRIS